MREPRRRLPRAERSARAQAVAADHDGIAHRDDLRAAGITRDDVRTEVEAGRWTLLGRHTVGITVGASLPERARLQRAVWESGSGAALDGVSALIAAGLRGFTADLIDVALPSTSRGRPLDGVRLRRRRDIGPLITAGIRRTRPEAAAIRAAQWAVSDRQALLILCLVVQQRLTHGQRLIDALGVITRAARRTVIEAAVRDLCDGVHSLGELDFALLCRRRGLPPPSRQVVRQLPSGRIYLDVAWEDIGLVVEIDGGHHSLALHPVDDALRQNAVAIEGSLVLRIPVLGLRLHPDDFLDQVEQAYQARLVVMQDARHGARSA